MSLDHGAQGQDRTLARLRDGIPIAFTIAVGCLAGYLTAVRPVYAIVASVAVLSIGLASCGALTIVMTSPRTYRWIPMAWVTLLFVSGIESELRDPLAVTSGHLTRDTIVELGLYGLIASAVVIVWRRRQVRSISSRTWPLILWPLFAAASSLWSLTPLFSLVRAAQLLIVVLFALLCIRLTRNEPVLRRSIVADTLRLFVLITTLLAIIGLIDRTYWIGDRFVWPMGAHPIAVGMVLGAALLVLLLGGRLFPRLPWIVQPLMASVVLAATFFGRNRSVLIATLAAAVVGLWFTPDRRVIASRFLTLPAVAATAILFAILAADAIVVYFSRGQSAGLLLSLTGRVDLWEGAVEHLDSATRWAIGFGYGSSRTLLLPEFGWGGHAHNALIESTLGIGLIGTSLVVIAVAAVGRTALSPALRKERVLGRLEPAIFAYLVVMGVVEAALVIPGFGFVMLMLVYVSGSSQTESPPPSGAVRAHTRREQLRAGAGVAS